MNSNAETSIGIDSATTDSNATASTSNSREPPNGNAVVVRMLGILFNIGNDPSLVGSFEFVSFNE